MGDNGQDGPEKSAEKGPNGRDLATGRLLPGHSLKSPGRPRNIDLKSGVAQVAKENGTTVEREMSLALWRLIQQAKEEGDVKSFVAAADRVAEPVERGALIEIDARTVVGPPMPAGLDLGKCLERLHEVAEQQGLLNGSDE